MVVKDRSIVITGSGSGLGRAVALRYAREGWRVGVLDRDAERAEAVALEVEADGGAALPLACDVTDEAALNEAAARVGQAWGAPDVLVANAGVAASGTLTDTALADWRWVFEVNVFGVVSTCRAFLPAMQSRGGGHVVAVASAAGFVSAPGMTAYNASKAAVISVCESLRSELAGAGIGVSVACPSFFRTRLLESFRGTEASRDIAAKLMDRSAVQAEDVAEHIHAGVEKKQFLILPHADASRILLVKRLLPELFHALVRKRGAKMLVAGGGSS
jgi:NADP-dependent 3-hydroxy acid dehydrogenase YdfG